MIRDIVVIGGSAGGIEALKRVVATLPSQFHASIAIVIHTAADSPGILDQILTQSGPLIAVTPNDRDRMEPGRI